MDPDENNLVTSLNSNVFVNKIFFIPADALISLEYMCCSETETESTITETLNPEFGNH